MFRDLEARIDRIVEDLLRGRRLRVGAAEAREREAVMAAAELAAAREGHPRMAPAFRRRLAASLAGGRDPGLVTRRTALGAVAGLAAGAVGAAALGRLPGESRAPAGHPAAPGSSVAAGVMKPGGGRWIPVAAFADLSEEAPTRVVAGDLVAYLFRRDQEVSGVSGICTHLPCTLSWQGQGGVLNCPCHNVDFRPDGSSPNTSYPIPPLPQVEVKVEAGQVYVYSA